MALFVFLQATAWARLVSTNFPSCYELVETPLLGRRFGTISACTSRWVIGIPIGSFDTSDHMNPQLADIIRPTVSLGIQN